MTYQWIIIDGYNLLYQAREPTKPSNNNIACARNRLLQTIANTIHEIADKATIVFDGRRAEIDHSQINKSIEVVFSPTHLSADSVIERFVCQHTAPEKVLVVTSDRAEQETVLSAGAQTISSQAFLELCNKPSKTTYHRIHRKKSRPTLGDLFPDAWNGPTQDP